MYTYYFDYLLDLVLLSASSIWGSISGEAHHALDVKLPVDLEPFPPFLGNLNMAIGRQMIIIAKKMSLMTPVMTSIQP